MKRFVLAGFAVILAAPLPVAAYEGPPEPIVEAEPVGPCAGEAYHQFDFWIGDWDVIDARGVLQGVNSITREEGGCLLVEHWTSTTGNTGQSYNFYNPGRAEWRQVWVSAGSVIDYSGGLSSTGSMKLEGTLTNPGDENTGPSSRPFTGEWTLNGDGTVTQHFELYDAVTETWSDWFTGIYHKKQG